MVKNQKVKLIEPHHPPTTHQPHLGGDLLQWIPKIRDGSLIGAFSKAPSGVARAGGCFLVGGFNPSEKY